MIGGRDVIIPTTRGTVALELAVRSITHLWPDAVIEDAESGETLQQDSDIRLADRHEILVFRDPKAAELWEQLGPDPSLDGTLIHFLVSDTDLTVAIDATPVPQVEAFVEALRESLAQGRVVRTAEPKSVRR
ncbi:MAG TPA: hypothetical protein VN541_19680 [Tepidisphaeraceae bacterium]|nr:hypothetical protein [Tepidisphaeraceae bacterium]